MLDNITSIGCISSRADEALQKLDEHIRTALNILLERSPEKLYGILESLGAKDNNDEDNYNLAQRAAKIIAIAKKTVTKVFSKLRKVPFSALAEAASGHQSKAAKELFEELKTISLEIRRQIDDNTELNDKYKVALQLIAENPLASWVTSQAIPKSWQPEGQSDLSFILLPIQKLFAERELPRIAMLERLLFLAVLYEEKIAYILLPIEKLFAARELSLVAMLERLLFLAVLYREKTANNENFTWTDFSFLGRITGNSPMEVAEVLTHADHSLFRLLLDADFLDNSLRLREMGSRWSDLASAVKACCVVYGNSGMVDWLGEISKCLIDRQNYYSATAFLIGIQNAGLSPNTLLSCMKYICSDGIYSFYMQEWSTRPGLPFIFPHIYRLNGRFQEKTRSEILSELLKFRSYGRRSSWDEDDSTDLGGYSFGVCQRAVLTKTRVTIFALAISALHGATHLIGCLPFTGKLPLEDIEKGSQELEKSTED